MSKEQKVKQEKILKAYPKFFRQYFEEDMTKTCMCWGLECGEGWFDLIDRMAAKIEKWNNDHPDQPPIEADQIKEKFGCYDDKTEVLTRNGWKFFKDVSFEDEIATLNKEELEYNFPSDIISDYYKGKMYLLKTRGVNLQVTLNHKLYLAKGLYYRKLKDKIIAVRKPMELVSYEKYFKKNKEFKKAAVWKGAETNTFVLPEYKYSHETIIHGTRCVRTYVKKPRHFCMDIWLSFLGWYVAEGHTNKNKNGQEISIAFNTKDNMYEANLILKIITALGYKAKIGKGIIRIYNSQLGRWLLENCGHLAPNKKSPEFIKNLSTRQIRIFLKALYEGDGHKSATANTLYTVSKKLCDDVQELILKEGHTSRFYIRPVREHNNNNNNNNIKGNYPCFCINWLQKSNYHNTQNKGLSKSSIEALVPYDGIVYCVTVPNNIIYVRREGIPVWCGNSLRVYLNYNNKETDDFVDEAEKEADETCELCGSKENVSTTKCGWITNMCEECHKKDRKAKLEDNA